MLTYRHRRIARKNSRGISLIEILVAVSIMSLVSAGVGFAVYNQMADAKKRLATMHLRELRNVVLAWRERHGETQCPTVGQLLADGVLDETAKAEDPWGRRFRVECLEGRVRTVSAGPDKTDNTEDDISIPEKRPQPIDS